MDEETEKIMIHDEWEAAAVGNRVDSKVFDGRIIFYRCFLALIPERFCSIAPPDGSIL